MGKRLKYCHCLERCLVRVTAVTEIPTASKAFRKTRRCCSDRSPAAAADSRARLPRRSLLFHGLKFCQCRSRSRGTASGCGRLSGAHPSPHAEDTISAPAKSLRKVSVRRQPAVLMLPCPAAWPHRREQGRAIG